MSKLNLKMHINLKLTSETDDITSTTVKTETAVGKTVVKVCLG